MSYADPIFDRDPGDETQARPVSRSYRATYQPPPEGAIGTLSRFYPPPIYRDFIGPDSFLHAVELAENTREDGERLVNVREQT